jgi:hypothetical protein
MTTAQGGYAPISKWVKQVLGCRHTTVVVTVAGAVRCLLVAPRLTPAALARALPSEHAGSGRSCLRRGRRWWSGPTRDQTTSSAALLRLALTRLPAGHAVVGARDTPRLGPWEVGLAGLVGAGRPLPRGWAVLPYPWPQGRCRTTTLALLQWLQAAFPAGVRWPLGADRGLPRARLCAPLRHGGTGCSGRLRWRDWGTGAGVSARVAAHLEAGRFVAGPRTSAAIGRGRPAQPRVPGGGVVSAAVPAPPQHTQPPGTRREWARRATAHAQHRPHTQGRTTTPPRATAQR